jgi:hypothetical protein
MTKPCSWCAGHSWEPGVDGFTPVACSRCRGIGRVPGVDPAIASHLVALAGRTVGVLLRVSATAGLAVLLGCPWSAAAALALVAGLSAR